MSSFNSVPAVNFTYCSKQFRNVSILLIHVIKQFLSGKCLEKEMKVKEREESWRNCWTRISALHSTRIFSQLRVEKGLVNRNQNEPANIMGCLIFYEARMMHLSYSSQHSYIVLCVAHPLYYALVKAMCL